VILKCLMIVLVLGFLELEKNDCVCMAWKTYIIKQFIQHITKRPLTQSRGLFFMSQSSNTMSQTTSDAAIPHFWSQYYFWCPNLTILLLNLTLLLLLMPQSHNTTSESHTFDRNTTFDAPISLLIAILHLMPQCHTFDTTFDAPMSHFWSILHLMPQCHTFDTTFDAPISHFGQTKLAMPTML